MKKRDPGPLPPKIDELAAAVATGESVASASKRLKVAPRTAYRWSVDPAFRARVRELRDDAVRRASDRLAALAGMAADRLRALLGSKDERVALRAASVILRNTVWMSDHAEITRRLAEIEESLTKHEQATKR